LSEKISIVSEQTAAVKDSLVALAAKVDKNYRILAKAVNEL